MKIDGEYQFDAPRAMVWESLLDPGVLAQVMPGCEKLDRTGDNAYEGALKIKVGPVQGLFQGKVELSDIEPPERYHMVVNGRGAPGFVKATADVVLSDGESGGTVMSYSSDAQVGGRIASVGQRLLDSSAKAIIKQSLDGLAGLIKARAAAHAAGEDTEAVQVEAPSQTDLAVNVAKEVAKDLIPRPVIYVALAIVVAVILWLVL